MASPRTKKGASGPELERSRQELIQQTQALVTQIRAALTTTLERIPAIDTVEEGAVLFVAANQIKADLATIQRDVSARIVKLSPTRIISPGKDTERVAPVKEQIIDGVGIVTITNDADKKWADKREMAHNILSWLAAVNEGEYLTAAQTVNMIFDIFAVGDPRVTALREFKLPDGTPVNLGGRYEQEPWLDKQYRDTVTVAVR